MDAIDRRQMLVTGVAALGASLPLVLATNCSTASNILNTDGIHSAVCDLFHAIKPMYPDLRKWVIAHRETFSSEVWAAMEQFDRKSATIAAVLDEACVTRETSQKWADAAATVVQVAQVGLKIGQLAVAAGVL